MIIIFDFGHNAALCFSLFLFTKLTLIWLKARNMVKSVKIELAKWSSNQAL